MTEEYCPHCGHKKNCECCKHGDCDAHHHHGMHDGHSGDHHCECHHHDMHRGHPAHRGAPHLPMAPMNHHMDIPKEVKIGIVVVGAILVATAVNVIAMKKMK